MFKRITLILLLTPLMLKVKAQVNLLDSARFSTDRNRAVRVEKVFGDSLATSFVIDIEQEVKLHKHARHSEHVYVVSGTAKMWLGEKEIWLKPGDLIFIPQGTPHKVLVLSGPFRVLSVQSPVFYGDDRIMLE